MADISIKLKKGNQQEVDIDRFDGLREVIVKSEKTTDANRIFYGIMASDGEMTIKDQTGDLRQLFHDFDIYSKDNVKVFGNGKLQGDLILNDCNLLQDGIFTAQLNGKLSNWENIKYNGHFFTTRNESLYEILNDVLGSALDDSVETTSTKYTGNLQIYNSDVKTFLQSIVLESNYMKPSSLKDAITKICEVAQLNVYEREDGVIIFALARPLINEISDDIKIYKLGKRDFTNEPSTNYVIKNKITSTDQINLAKTFLSYERQTVFSTDIKLYDKTRPVLPTPSSGWGEIPNKNIDYRYTTLGDGSQSIEFLMSVDFTSILQETIFDNGDEKDFIIKLTYDQVVYQGSDTNGLTLGTKEAYLQFGGTITPYYQYDDKSIFFYDKSSNTNSRFQFQIPTALTYTEERFLKANSNYFIENVKIEITKNVVILNSQEQEQTQDQTLFLQSNELMQKYAVPKEPPITQSTYLLKQTILNNMDLFGFEYLLNENEFIVKDSRTFGFLGLTSDNFSGFFTTGDIFYGAHSSTKSAIQKFQITSIGVDRLQCNVWTYDINDSLRNSQATKIKQNIVSDYQNGLQVVSCETLIKDISTDGEDKLEWFYKGETLAIGDFVKFDNKYENKIFEVVSKNFSYAGYPKLTMSFLEVPRIPKIDLVETSSPIVNISIPTIKMQTYNPAWRDIFTILPQKSSRSFNSLYFGIFDSLMFNSDTDFLDNEDAYTEEHINAVLDDELNQFQYVFGIVPNSQDLNVTITVYGNIKGIVIYGDLATGQYPTLAQIGGNSIVNEEGLEWHIQFPSGYPLNSNGYWYTPITFTHWSKNDFNAIISYIRPIYKNF